MLSYGEKLLRAYVKRCFPLETPLYNFRGSGIKNKDTNSPLEIDIFLPKLMLGFEFHGRQHRTDEYQRFKDKQKRKQAKEKGIILIEIWTLTLEKDIYEIIKEHAPHILIKNPTKHFKAQFKQSAETYRKNIYKMNKKISSSTFVARRSYAKKKTSI